MRGKKVCNALKRVRLDIAKANGIKLDIPECTHKGECLGTCPRCEWEVKYLERELEKKRKSGAKVLLAGVSAGLVAVNAVACGPFTCDGLMEELEGDVAVPVATEATTETEAVDGNMIPATEDEPEFLGESPETEIAGAVPLETGDETEEIWLDGDIAFIPDTEEVLATAGVMPAPEGFGEDE